MSENGEVRGIAEKRRMHGAPWARLYRRYVWNHIRFPEGFWFEDSLIAYCVKPQFRECLSNDAGYLRRYRTSSITSKAPYSPKSLDAFWIVAEMLDWCKYLKIPLSLVYEQTIHQFGPLLISRTRNLTEEQRKSLFICCVNLLEKEYGDWWQRDKLPNRWGYVEEALWTRNYLMWIEACKWVS